MRHPPSRACPLYRSHAYDQRRDGEGSCWLTRSADAAERAWPWLGFMGQARGGVSVLLSQQSYAAATYRSSSHAAAAVVWRCLSPARGVGARAPRRGWQTARPGAWTPMPRAVSTPRSTDPNAPVGVSCYMSWTLERGGQTGRGADDIPRGQAGPVLKRDSERCCNGCITAVLLLYDSMTLKGVHRGEHAPVRASHALWSRRGCALGRALHVDHV